VNKKPSLGVSGKPPHENIVGKFWCLTHLLKEELLVSQLLFSF
jgi:hypothetical protein